MHNLQKAAGCSLFCFSSHGIYLFTNFVTHKNRENENTDKRCNNY